jgi:hypothetical protein
VCRARATDPAHVTGTDVCRTPTTAPDHHGPIYIRGIGSLSRAGRKHQIRQGDRPVGVEDSNDQGAAVGAIINAVGMGLTATWPTRRTYPRQCSRSSSPALFPSSKTLQQRSIYASDTRALGRSENTASGRKASPMAAFTNPKTPSHSLPCRSKVGTECLTTHRIRPRTMPPAQHQKQRTCLATAPSAPMGGSGVCASLSRPVATETFLSTSWLAQRCIPTSVQVLLTRAPSAPAYRHTAVGLDSYRAGPCDPQQSHDRDPQAPS